MVGDIVTLLPVKPGTSRSPGPSVGMGISGVGAVPLSVVPNPQGRGSPLHPTPTSLFAYISNHAVRSLIYFKSWLHLEIIGLCSAPAVLIGSEFLGNLNTGIL